MVLITNVSLSNKLILLTSQIEAAAKDKACFCIGWNVTTWHGFEEGLKSTEEIKYLPWCGECIDPCALRFKWDSHFTQLKGIVAETVVF